MKIAVFSDSHGNVERMCTAVEDWQPQVLIHLGDLVRDADELARRYPRMSLYQVAGNCDYAPAVEDSLLLELEGVRIFAAHGHRHQVKFGLDSFANSAFCSGAKLGLFGHTHRAMHQQIGALQLVNPGSCGNGSSPTYAQIELKNGEVFAKIVKIDD